METQQQFRKTLDVAIRRTAEVHKKFGDEALVLNIEKQLDFIRRSIARLPLPPAAERERVNVGVIAVRELEEFDAKYADQLTELDYWFRHWEELLPE